MSTHREDPPRIAICVATFQRPRGLAQLLTSLQALETDGFHPHLIVADNDATESARPVVETFRESMSFQVTYVVEPTRGISSVRNRLVKEALAHGVEFIAFVDDDETVDPRWIAQLIATAKRTGADAVGGPQIHDFDDDVPMYLQHCFTHQVSPGDTPVTRVSTGNVLYRVRMLQQIPGPFEINLNLSGGADSLLAENILKRGGLILWCNNAITYEHVPESRLNARWVLRRQFRVGAGESQITRSVNTGMLPLWKNAAHGIGVMGLGSLRLILSAFTDRDRMLQWLSMISFGLGELLGVFTSKATLSQYGKIEGE